MERNPDSHAGSYGWLIVGAAVVAIDVISPESLTHAFERARTSENALIRIAAMGGLAITALHLLDKLPRSVDPFYLTIDSLNRGEE